jgi:hypothetical protein
MADDRFLFYLVEGTPKLSSISISCNSMVDNLREDVFGECRQLAQLALSYCDLSILKVGIKLMFHFRSRADASYAF